MCGIAGIFRPNQPDPLDPSRLATMASLLTHRGPDDCGYLLLNSGDGSQHRNPDVLLASRRLSIVDLSPAGRQPMQNETGEIFAVFNGEIFNYRELRKELAGRHEFRSHTDTEVIVHAYEQWGQDCVTRFNGMWAFALWDQRKRELFCSRDRFGIKPFYYCREDGAFLFASEVKAILPALVRRPRPHEGAISDYLVNGWLCRSKETFFGGIERLMPAHNLVIDGDGCRFARYWDYPRGRHGSREPVAEFRELLRDAVHLRTHADVPAGIALSGGIDSTAILALTAETAGARGMPAFTAVFPGESYNEHGYAQLAAQSQGASLRTVEYRPSNFMDDLREVTWALDYPAVDPQVLARREVMRLAGRHVKVILEGQGADEMLAGYITRYFAPHLIDQLAKRGRGIRQLVSEFQTVSRMDRNSAWAGVLRQLAPKQLPLRSLRTLWESNRVYTEEFLRNTSGRELQLPTTEFPDRLTNLLHFDHAVGILPMLLKFGDALSMMHSIESRVPFLDHRLVEFVFGLESRHKLAGSLTKGILREAMAGIIPEKIRARRDKVGFVTPLARWIEEFMDESIRPLLLSSRCLSRGIFDRKKVQRVLDAQRAGRVHAEYAIFRWLSVELWFRLFIDGEGYATLDVAKTGAELAGVAPA